MGAAYISINNSFSLTYLIWERKRNRGGFVGGRIDRANFSIRRIYQILDKNRGDQTSKPLLYPSGGASESKTAILPNEPEVETDVSVAWDQTRESNRSLISNREGM